MSIMKLLKKFFIVIIVIIALILVFALFVKKEYSVERNITINKTKSEVFEYLKYLRNQDDFSVWANIDPGMKKEYSGIDGTVGFVSAWDSENKNVGRGEQEIKNIVEGKRIDYELRFYEPFESTESAYITTENYKDSLTLVTWGFHGKMNYPANLMLIFYDMEKMIGKDMETGLSNLKEILEE